MSYNVIMIMLLTAGSSAYQFKFEPHGSAKGKDLKKVLFSFRRFSRWLCGVIAEPFCIVESRRSVLLLFFYLPNVFQ